MAKTMCVYWRMLNIIAKKPTCHSNLQTMVWGSVVRETLNKILTSRCIGTTGSHFYSKGNWRKVVESRGEGEGEEAKNKPKRPGQVVVILEMNNGEIIKTSETKAKSLAKSRGMHLVLQNKKMGIKDHFKLVSDIEYYKGKDPVDLNEKKKVLILSPKADLKMQKNRVDIIRKSLQKRPAVQVIIKLTTDGGDTLKYIEENIKDFAVIVDKEVENDSISFDVVRLTSLPEESESKNETTTETKENSEDHQKDKS